MCASVTDSPGIGRSRLFLFGIIAVKADAISYPPRGLSREEAARYVGVGPTLFDEMVADGRMPKPKLVNSRAIWDRITLDISFTSLPDKESGLRVLLERSGQNPANGR